MKILLIGCSGMLGQALLKCEWAKQHTWLGVARRVPPQEERLHAKFISKDLNSTQEPAFWEQQTEGIDIVINCLGIIRETPHQSFFYLHHHSPEVIFKAAAKKGVRHIIQVSALGAEQPVEKLFSQYHRTKQAADQVLMRLNCPHSILYPSVILSPTGQSTQLFLTLAALPLTAYPAVKALLQPIALHDVLVTIEKLVNTIAQKGSCPTQLIAVGPTPVTLRQLLSLFKHSLGLPKALIPLPLFLNRMVAELGEWNHNIPLNREMFAMLLAGNANPDKTLASWLGHPLTPLPTAIKQAVAPGSFIRRELEIQWLRWSLVFIWLFTAAVSIANYSEGVRLMSALNAPVPASLYPLAIYGGAGIDALAGICIAFKKRYALWLSLLMMLLYSVIVTIYQPIWWFDPLGQLSKNIPIAVLTWVVLMNTPSKSREH